MTPGKCPFPGGQCPFPGVLVLSTKIVAVDLVYYTYDGRARLVTVAKNLCLLNKHNLVAIATPVSDLCP